MTQEGEAGVLVVPPARAVFAVDDRRLVRVEPQAHLLHPLGNSSEHPVGLDLVRTVHDRVVGIALPRTTRELPGHPAVERIMHEQVSQDG